MQKRRLCYFLFLIFLVGCATAGPSLTVVDDVGRNIPDQSFKVKDVNNQLFAAFWFEVYTTQNDLDGHTISIPHYLSLNRNVFDPNKVKDLQVRIEIHNPKRISYSLMSMYKFKLEGQYSAESREVSRSNLSHRSYQFKLPMYVGMKDAKYSLFAVDDKGNFLFQVGAFNYEIKEVVH